MKQTLIKITDDHYVVVDDSEIKEGDYYFSKISDNVFRRSNGGHWIENYDKKMYQKITHSTQPNKGMENVTFISPREVKELIGDVDVYKKAREEHEQVLKRGGSEYAAGYYEGLIDGYNQSLEDNKEKKYIEDDLRKAYMYGDNYHKHTVGNAQKYTFESLIQSLQPKTEWEVTFDKQGKLKLI